MVEGRNQIQKSSDILRTYSYIITFIVIDFIISVSFLFAKIEGHIYISYIYVIIDHIHIMYTYIHIYMHTHTCNP